MMDQRFSKRNWTYRTYVSSGNEMDKKETSFESVLHIYLNISREKAFGRIIDSG